MATSPSLRCSMGRRGRGVEQGRPVARRLGMAHRGALVDARAASFSRCGRRGTPRAMLRGHARQTTFSLFVRGHGRRCQRAPRSVRRRVDHRTHRRRHRRQRQPDRMPRRDAHVGHRVRRHRVVQLREQMLAHERDLQQRHVERRDRKSAGADMPELAADERRGVRLLPVELSMSVCRRHVQRHAEQRRSDLREREVAARGVDVQSARAGFGDSGRARGRRERRCKSHRLTRSKGYARAR